MRTNWKLALDTFCEGYHFGPLHKDSVGDYSLSNISVYDRFGPNQEHHRLAFPNKTIRDLKGVPEDQWGSTNDVFQHFQLVHFIFPNISLLISPRACEFFQLYPGKSVDEHVTRYSSYFRGHIELETEEHWQEAYDHFDFIYKVVETEDYWVSENVQKSFNAKIKPFTTFGKNEPALINMHKTFRKKMGLKEKEPKLERVGL